MEGRASRERAMRWQPVVVMSETSAVRHSPGCMAARGWPSCAWVLAMAAE
jgi:hypothetical protein